MAAASRLDHPPVSDVLIVGAGPAGLVAAIALRQAGVKRVTIAERGTPDAVLGSELQLQSAAMRTLESIGCAQACAEAGAVLEYSRYLTPDGAIIAEMQDPKIVTRERTPPRVGISRPALHRVLTAAAIDIGCGIRHHCKLVGIEPDGDRVIARFEDGTSGSHDLLVGADGAGSTVRSLVFPEAPAPEYIGQVCWRARVPRVGPPGMEIYLGERTKVGIIAVNDTEAYLFHLEPEPDYRWIDRALLPATLRSKLQGYGGRVAEVRDHIRNPEMVHYSPLSPLLLPPPWHSGRVLLIGDAVHATTPHLAYGAGLAMEDGVVLGEEIARADNLDAALHAFTVRRWDRCRLVVESGAQIARWEIAPETPGADPIGLSRAMQSTLAEAI